MTARERSATIIEHLAADWLNAISGNDVDY